MPKVFDGQNDFSGGMIDRVKPTRLSENQYAEGKNIVIRDGFVRTRPGSILMTYFDQTYELQGAGFYTAPFQDQRNQTIVVARNGLVYRIHPPQDAVQMEFDTGITFDVNEEVRFVQAYNYLYMLRGYAKPVLRWDGYASSKWEAIDDPITGDKFPNTSYGIYAYNRGWVVTDGDTINASDLLSEAFDLTYNVFEIDNGEGGNIVSIKQFLDGSLIVLKEKSVHYLSNCNPAEATLTPGSQFIDAKHGAVSTDACVQVGNDIWFLSHDGVRSVMLTSDNKAQSRDITLTFDIPNLIKRINWVYANNAQAAVYDNYFLFAVPFDSSSVNDTILVYDLILKTWVGYWQGIECQKFFIGTEYNDKVLYSLDRYGNIAQLFRGYYEDYVSRNNSNVIFDYKNYEYIELRPILIASDLFTFGNGLFSIDVFPEDLTYSGDDALIFYLGNSNVNYGTDYIYAEIGGNDIRLKLSVGGVSQWLAHFPLPLIKVLNKWYNLTILHNGSEVVVYWDGNLLTGTWYTTTDKTKWITDIASACNYFRLGGPSNSGIRSIDGGIRKFSYFKTDITGAKTFYCMLPLSEGTGSTVYDIVTNEACTMTLGSWKSFPPPTNIENYLKTRAYGFQSEAFNKIIGTGEVTILNRDPSFNLNLLTEKPFDTTELFSTKTYPYKEYDIHGKEDWTETGIDFADPNRKNYAPVYWPTAGLSLESVAGVSYDVLLDQEQEHTEQFFSGKVCSSCQLELTNTVGTIALKSIALTANQKSFGKKSED